MQDGSATALRALRASSCSCLTLGWTKSSDNALAQIPGGFGVQNPIIETALHSPVDARTP